MIDIFLFINNVQTLSIHNIHDPAANMIKGLTRSLRVVRLGKTVHGWTSHSGGNAAVSLKPMTHDPTLYDQTCMKFNV